MDKPSIIRLLIRVNRQRRDLMKPYYSAIGMTSFQVSTLACIADHPGRMQKEIAEDIGVSPTVMVGILRNLEEKNLIECSRKANNRRAISVSLTEEGEKLMEIINVYVRKSAAIALYGFTPEEQDQLSTLLLRICDNLQKQ